MIGDFGDEFSEFVVSVYNSAAMIDIRSPNDGLFKLRYHSKDLYELRKIKVATEPDCHVGMAGQFQNLKPENPAPSPYIKTPSLHEQSDDGSVIDVMAVYTEQAAVDSGSDDAIRANIDAAFNIANAVFRRSGVQTQLRLVFIHKSDYIEDGEDSSVDLNRLRKNSDGYMDDVHYWRDRVGADFVTLFRSGNVRGHAYIYNPSRWPDMSVAAFSVVRYDAGLLLAHEIGHNFGCHHAVGDEDLKQGQNGRFYYSHGWRFTGSNDQTYRTIMGYPPGVWIGYFSNPNVILHHQPVGDKILSDNVRGINNIRPYLAGLRTSTVALEIYPHTPFVAIGSSGGAVASDKYQYEIVNAASTPITFSVTKNADWYSVDYTTNTIQANGSLKLDITINQSIEPI